jgi:sialic acid synthase SpsE
VQALALIDAAAAAGADAVKFQTFTAEGTYVPNAGASDYLSQAGIRQEITKIFKDMTLPHAMIPVLAAHCQARGIEFMSSYFSPEDFKAVDPFVRRHKIGSYEIGHLRLLELAASSGKPLILSTGGATEEEIAWASEIFWKNGGEQLILMQCTARYPAPLSALHVRAIPWMRARFNVPVGFSDHSREPLIAPLCAVAQGAVAIEKHFTLDNSLKGPDHAFAITPPELKELVQSIRGAEKVLGSPVKFVDPEENELRDYAHRGVQAIRAIQKGDVLREGDNIAILRPGKQLKGVHSKYITEMEGKKARNPIALGQGIQNGD